MRASITSTPCSRFRRPYVRTLSRICRSYPCCCPVGPRCFGPCRTRRAGAFSGCWRGTCTRVFCWRGKGSNAPAVCSAPHHFLKNSNTGTRVPYCPTQCTLCCHSTHVFSCCKYYKGSTWAYDDVSHDVLLTALLSNSKTWCGCWQAFSSIPFLSFSAQQHRSGASAQGHA